MLRRKWPTASKVYLALALVSGLAAFGLSRGYARKLETLHPDFGVQVPVVFTTDRVPRGAEIAASEVEIRQVPTSFAPAGAFGALADVTGRVAVADIAPGEPVTATRVAAPRAGPIAALVPVGLQAFSIDAGVPIDAVRPGDHVDVLATYGGGHPHTESVASGVEVLLVLRPEVGSTLDAGASTGPQIVLLVSNDVAQRLAYAVAFGKLAVAIDGAPAMPIGDPATPSPAPSPSS